MGWEEEVEVEVEGTRQKSRAGERNTAQKSSYIGYAGRK